MSEVIMLKGIDGDGRIIYVAKKGDQVVVHSSLLKRKWESKEHFGDFDKYESIHKDSYFYDSSVLEHMGRIW